MITLALPFPPSVNNMWRQFRGRSILSKEVRAWWNEAEVWFLQAKANHILDHRKALPRISGHFEIEIVLDEARRRSNSDLDNRLKAPIDAAQKFGLIENDKYCDKITASWGRVHGCLLTIKSAELAK